MPDLSPDHDDRIKDFMARHGGAGPKGERSDQRSDLQGWIEVDAVDGYVLRCEWDTSGTQAEMKYSEIAPGRT